MFKILEKELFLNTMSRKKLSNIVVSKIKGHTL